MKLYTKSWSLLKDNLRYLPIPMLTDLLTLTFILFLANFYKFVTIERFSALLTSAVQAQPAGNELQFIILSTLILYMAIYISFTLLQSVSWYWSYKFCKIQLKFSKILKHYALYNLIWTVLLLIITVIHKLLLISDTFVGGDNNAAITAVAGIFYFIIFYLAIISYLMQPLKTGIKKGNIIIPVLFLIWVTYQVLDYFAFLSGSISQILGVVVSMFILLPIFVWARNYLILAMKEVLK